MQKIDGLRPKTACLFDAYCGRGHDRRLKWNGPRAVETWDGDKMSYIGNPEVTAQVERIRREQTGYCLGSEQERKEGSL